MKKTITLSKNINDALVKFTKENETTQSKTIEIALTLYLDKVGS